MESEIKHLPSELFTNESLARQLVLIKQAASEAEQRINYESAHDEETLHAIHIVEAFLAKKRRICYGGQAINAYLPAKHKFYDPEYSIPDYDFFTPNQNLDVEHLARDLFRAGFTDVSAREGMHEGTIKMYVNYVPVADITSIHPSIYRMLSKKASTIEGIHYIDANSLRMLMYLELSRPRGEVSRWEKVFERLMLFNEFVPIRKMSRCSTKSSHSLSPSQVQFVLRYLIQHERIFAGGDLVPFYDKALTSRKLSLSYLLTSKRPLIFYSPMPSEDADLLRGVLGASVRVVMNQGLDIIPSIHMLHRKGKLLVLIIEQSECHSYVNVKMGPNTLLRLASMDTLITLYFSLGFVQHAFIDRGAMECLANELVHISIRARRHPGTFLFPFISIECQGHQTSLPSLIKAKLERMTVKKKDTLKGILKEAERKGTRKGTRKRTQKATQKATPKATYNNGNSL